MSAVEKIVFEQLSGQNLERLPNGFRLIEPPGTTDITFRRAPVPANEWGLCSIAIVETRLPRSLLPFTESEVEQLNAVAVFGHYNLTDDALCLKLSLSIREQDPGHRWLALFLLHAFGSQLASGFGTARIPIDEKFLEQDRANTRYPRQWSRPPSAKEFSEAAESFMQAGYPPNALYVGPDQMILEVPLSDTALPSILDPASEVAILRVDSTAPHPIAGVGCRCMIVLPINPPDQQAAAWCRTLNLIEHEQNDFVPRIGAWGLHEPEGRLAYSLFVPEGLLLHPVALMDWMAARTFWLKEQFWMPGEGLAKRTFA